MININSDNLSGIKFDLIYDWYNTYDQKKKYE